MRSHKDPALVPPPACDDEADWLGRLGVIPAGAARTLLVAMRTLYPHEALPDAVYRRCVLQIDAGARRQSALAAAVTGFLQALDAGGGPRFADRDESSRVATLTALDGTPAFGAVQRATVRHLYDDLVVWQAFGYEGAAHHLGGYVGRGFDDLDWLPPIPEAAP